VRAPWRPAADRLAGDLFETAPALTLGLVRGAGGALRTGPLTWLRFAAPEVTEDADQAAVTLGIEGGLLARRPGGRLTIGWREGELYSRVEGYLPSLPALVYRATQRPFHHLVTRLFLLRLRGPMPPAGRPASIERRTVASLVDIALCAGLAAAGEFLARRRRARRGSFARRTAAVGIAYHLWFWSRGGRTPGSRLAQVRLVSVDGTGADWSQALVRLAVVPLIPFLGAGAADDAAGTSVIRTSAVRGAQR
jgi:uncharacterized RDD family membrane protein YckC